VAKHLARRLGDRVDWRDSRTFVVWSERARPIAAVRIKYVPIIWSMCVNMTTAPSRERGYWHGYRVRAVTKVLQRLLGCEDKNEVNDETNHEAPGRGRKVILYPTAPRE
jgi:hypothetical protein